MSAGTPERVVVVGGGVAAQRCTFELRAAGFDGEVVIVAAEPHVPYDRTLLSKDLLVGMVAADELALRAVADYEARGIELRLGAAAAALDPDGQRLILDDGTELAYDRLVIATGGAPARPRSIDHPAAHVVRTVADAEALRARLADVERLVVVGAGFIGGEVAASARTLGIEVTLVEALDAPLAGVVGAEVGARVAQLHREEGVEVLTGTPVGQIREAGRGVEVMLADGRAVAGDAVVIGAGMVPATGWLAGAGIGLDGGVLTDALCRTGAPGVFAAGDCARWFNPRYGRLMRVEHWDTAGRHGAAAARAALGEGEPFAPVPFFWSSQHGVRFQWVGVADGWDEVEIEDVEPARSFVARYRRDGRVVAALAAGNPRIIAEVRRDLETTEVPA